MRIMFDIFNGFTLLDELPFRRIVYSIGHFKILVPIPEFSLHLMDISKRATSQHDIGFGTGSVFPRNSEKIMPSHEKDRANTRDSRHNQKQDCA